MHNVRLYSTTMLFFNIVISVSINYDCFFAENDDVTTGLELLHWKTVAEAFWNGEIEDELMKLGWTNKLFKTKKAGKCT